MVLTPTQLPSDASKEIQLREINVKDAIDLSAISEETEELMLTEFLNKAQKPESSSNSLEWTSSDRYWVLIWYLSQTQKKTINIEEYDCGVCGEKHGGKSVSMIDFGANYAPISGKPYREFNFDDRSITVSPINGLGRQYLEVKRNSIANSSEKERKTIMEFTETLLSIDFTHDENSDAEKVELWLKSLDLSNYKKLSNMVSDAQHDMSHGVDGRYDVVSGKTEFIYDAACENKEGEVQKLLVPFLVKRHVPEL